MLQVQARILRPRQSKMRTSCRLLFWTLSALVSISLLALTGGLGPAARLLQNQFLYVLSVFFIVFVLFMAFAVRGGLVRSLLIVLLAAVLMYPCAALLYIAYFIIMEPACVANSIKHFSLT
jgi:hypothetical protein